MVQTWIFSSGKLVVVDCVQKASSFCPGGCIKFEECGSSKHLNLTAYCWNLGRACPDINTWFTDKVYLDETHAQSRSLLISGGDKSTVEYFSPDSSLPGCTLASLPGNRYWGHTMNGLTGDVSEIWDRFSKIKSVFFLSPGIAPCWGQENISICPWDVPNYPEKVSTNKFEFEKLVPSDLRDFSSQSVAAMVTTSTNALLWGLEVGTPLTHSAKEDMTTCHGEETLTSCWWVDTHRAVRWQLRWLGTTAVWQKGHSPWNIKQGKSLVIFLSFNLQVRSRLKCSLFTHYWSACPLYGQKNHSQTVSLHDRETHICITTDYCRRNRSQVLTLSPDQV